MKKKQNETSGNESETTQKLNEILQTTKEIMGMLEKLKSESGGVA